MAAIYGAHRITVQGISAGQQVANIFHVGSAAELATAVADVGTHFATAFKPVLSGNYAFDQAYGVDMSSAAGAVANFDLSTFESGLGGPGAENGTSALLRWIDTVDGRGFRSGRTFLGPVAQDDLMPGGLELTQSAQVAFQAAANQFLSLIDTTGFALIMPHGINTANQQLAVITGCQVRTATGHLDSRRK